jgi:hypothetical protein
MFRKLNCIIMLVFFVLIGSFIFSGFYKPSPTPLPPELPLPESDIDGGLKDSITYVNVGSVPNAYAQASKKERYIPISCVKDGMQLQ